MNLFFASKGIVFDHSLNLSNCIDATKKSFYDPSVVNVFKKKIQKHLALDIKSFLFPDSSFVDLSFKAAKQTILLSPEDISCVVKSLSKLPFILSVTFHKVLTNSLCTTNRI